MRDSKFTSILMIGKVIRFRYLTKANTGEIKHGYSNQSFRAVGQQQDKFKERKMNRTTKIIVGVIAGVLILCFGCAMSGILLFNISSRTIERSIQTSSGSVTEIGSDIAEYDLPAGFGEGYAAQAADFSMVAYLGKDGHSHIYFLQLPAYLNLDEAEIRQRMQQAQESGDLPEELKVVETQTGVIRGQEIELVVSEGNNHEGQSYRQVSGVFRGKGGQAMVVFEAPVEAWDQAMVDAFLDSIQ